MYAKLSKYFDKIIDETGKEIESVRVMFTKDLEKEKFEQNEIREELKKLPPMFNITPLKTKMGLVQVLEKKLKENEDLIIRGNFNSKWAF